MGFWIILLLGVAAVAYVRLAPSDPVRWHARAKIEGTESKQLKNGYIWRKVVSGDGAAELAALDQAATAQGNTTRLAGSVAEGQTTYLSRTKVVGFPDYTTIGSYQMPDGQTVIEAYGRLRFGGSDIGVNAKRIKGWVAAAQL
ncbi:MAG: DUF1499 domain-containing protein [Sulfitobacter sp.]